MKILGWIMGRNSTLEDRNAFPHSALRECGNEEREEDRIIRRAELTALFLQEEDRPLLADRQLREKRTALFLRECGNDADSSCGISPSLKNYSVQERIISRTGPKPVLPILWDRRSRFGPVDRHWVGLCPSLPINPSILGSTRPMAAATRYVTVHHRKPFIFLQLFLYTSIRRISSKLCLLSSTLDIVIFSSLSVCQIGFHISVKKCINVHD